jgi:hypothetical protein
MFSPFYRCRCIEPCAQPFYVLSLIIFGLTTYLSLDVALGITETIGGPSNPPDSLRSISLFVLLNVWPALYVPSIFR